MANKLNIPFYTTREFKHNFFEQNNMVQEMFKNDYEHFLIAHFDDIRQVMHLPVSYYRRPVTEVVFITQGSITKGCNLNKVTVGEKQIHIWLANHIATVDAFSENISGFYCHFDFDYIVRAYHTTSIIKDLNFINTVTHYHGIDLPEASFHAILNIFERLSQVFHSDNDQSLINTYLVTLFLEIKKCLPAPKDQPEPNRASQLSNQFKESLFRNVLKEQSLQFYANDLCISQNHLNKVVKQATGKSAGTWLYEALALEAKVLLLQSSYSIGEIAFMLGFADQSYFTKFFKKHAGYPPSHFRKND